MLHGNSAPTGPLAIAAAGGIESDQRFILNNISWARYEALRELLDDVAGLRMTYLKGTLEITSPSRTHESVKSLVGRLIELYADVLDIPLYAYGSTTFRKQARERGLEPDECYSVGEDMKEVPDIAFEVILSSGGIEKLDVYAGIGVPEVWLWQDGHITVHQLEGGCYQLVERSRFLPKLDIGTLASLSNAPDQAVAVRTWRNLLHQRD